jgi:hypothetical protein
MKNLLAENMRRFGTKNLMPLHESTLSDDDILDIILSYTKDPDAAEAALANYRETGNFGDASIESNVTRDPRWTGAESDSDNDLPRDIQFVKDEMKKLIQHIKLKFSNTSGLDDKKIANIEFVVYDLLDPNTKGGSRPPNNFKFDNNWWNSAKPDIDPILMQDMLAQLASIAKYNGVMGQ